MSVVRCPLSFDSTHDPEHVEGQKTMVRQAVRQAHGPEQRRRTHHPEQSRRTDNLQLSTGTA